VIGSEGAAVSSAEPSPAPDLRSVGSGGGSGSASGSELPTSPTGASGALRSKGAASAKGSEGDASGGSEGGGADAGVSETGISSRGSSEAAVPVIAGPESAVLSDEGVGSGAGVLSDEGVGSGSAVLSDEGVGSGAGVLSDEGVGSGAGVSSSGGPGSGGGGPGSGGGGPGSEGGAGAPERSICPESSSVDSGSVAGGFSMRKISLHEEHRAFTPPSGIFAGSTGNEDEQEGQVTVMTIMDSVLGVEFDDPRRIR